MKSPFSLFKSVSLAVAAIVAMSVFMVSCLKDDHDSPPVDSAGLMVVNLVPDKSAVGVAIGGNVLTNAPLSFSNYTGGYLGVYPGARSLESFDFYSNSTLADTSYNFEKDKYYSAFIAGAADNYRNIIVLDDFDTLDASAGQAYVRYINAIPDSAKPTLTISANGNNVVNTQAGFGQVSEFVPVAPGSVMIDMTNGSGIDAERTITVEANTVYTVLLSGVAGSTTTPVAIKYITNGTLEQEEGARVSAASERVSN